ncbi:MAG TPA: 2-phospho-L-lactate transferase [Candidatus Binataceae bacterium]|nr:2-phospho-L-lactate transferase [Candidatus Binataceae bacterium]
MLAGGVGAARFLRGLLRRVDQRRIRVIVNTGDDEEFYGLHVSPDVDTIVYTLAGVANSLHGWGLKGESFKVLGALERFYGRAWFALGDRDLATHLYRTERLRAGRPLSQVTSEIAARFGIKSSVIPMSDDRVRTFVKLRGRPDALAFQEYLVHRRARGTIEAIELRGAAQAVTTQAALEAITTSVAVILAPSNPFVSLGPILALSGVREALRAAKTRVAAISPIVGGRTIKGPADRMMRGLGHEVSPLGVARLYQDLIGVFVLDNADRRYLASIEALGMRAVATDTIMTNPARAARLADVVMRALAV